MTDLQSDLRQLAGGLTKVLARLSGRSKDSSATLSELVPPKPPASAPFPPPDLELDLPLESGNTQRPAVAPRLNHPPRRGLLHALREPHSVRDAFVLKEILDRPRANRRFRAR